RTSGHLNRFRPLRRLSAPVEPSSGGGTVRVEAEQGVHQLYEYSGVQSDLSRRVPVGHDDEEEEEECRERRR
ncbi:unnamed protein product, partial [Mycena citricolor]